MAKNTIIVIITVLLCISSYLLYTNKNISINLGGTEADCGADTAGRMNDEKASSELPEKVVAMSVQIKNTPQGANPEEVEQVDSKQPEIHLDPTVGMSISADQQIVSSYKIIGPRKFSLLTNGDETMVEIDLDTGRVKINPKYKLDEATTQFWKSIAQKYPEVCSAE
jgi:hypothetical protein